MFTFLFFIKVPNFKISYSEIFHTQLNELIYNICVQLETFNYYEVKSLYY